MKKFPLIALIVSIILLLVGGFFFIQQTAYFDPYTSEDSFDIPSPALTGEACTPYLTRDCHEWTKRTCTTPCCEYFDGKKYFTSSFGCTMPPTSLWACTHRPSYIFCEDEKWLITKYGGNCCGLGGARGIACFQGSHEVSGNDLILTTKYASSTKATYLKDLKSRDIKTKTIGNVAVFLNDIQVFSGTGSNLIELKKDFENPDLIHTIVNAEEVGEYLIEDETVQLSIRGSGGGGSCENPGSASLSIDYIKSMPYESCNLEPDEAIWTGRYDSGKELSISDIPFVVTKFCPRERPVIKRNIETGGERANLEGSIYDKLRNGETIIVPENWVYELPIGVDYIEGMPLSNCPLGFYEDNAGDCNQKIFEMEDVVIIINNNIIIEIGKQDLFFDNSLSFADKEITSEKPQYSCASEDEKANSPDPRPECWNLDVGYTGQSYTFFYGEEKDFNGLLKLKALPEAQYKDGIVQEDYINHFVLTVTDDILESETIEEPLNNYWVIFGTDREIKFKVTNNLGDFKEGESGIQIRRTTSILTGESTELVNIPFKKGTKEYSVKVDSNIYEELLYTITFWYKIGDKTFYDDEAIVRNYQVVDEIPFDTIITEKVCCYADNIYFWEREDVCQNVVEANKCSKVIEKVCCDVDGKFSWLKENECENIVKDDKCSIITPPSVIEVIPLWTWITIVLLSLALFSVGLFYLIKKLLIKK